MHNFKYPKVFANEVDEPWIKKPNFSQCTFLNNPGNNYITTKISPTTIYNRNYILCIVKGILNKKSKELNRKK
jgi:hypothetical protein